MRNNNYSSEFFNSYKVDLIEYTNNGRKSSSSSIIISYFDQENRFDMGSIILQTQSDNIAFKTTTIHSVIVL